MALVWVWVWAGWVGCAQVHGCVRVSKDTACYSWLAIMSDVDDDGFALNVDGRKVQDLDYIRVRIMEQ
jgi:hypothetical protein